MVRPPSTAVAVAACLSMIACIGFGGPLIDDEDDADDEELVGDGDGDGGEDRCGPTSGVVDRVVDGDTIILESGERVRYILVDTPEITDGHNECWGKQASDHNAMLVLGETVTLTYDVECEDQYGRLLAYVEVGELEVNRELLETGQACFLHIPPNGNAKATEYQELEDAAKQAGIGMWGACGTVKCD